MAVDGLANINRLLPVLLFSPEIYRLQVALDIHLDSRIFILNYWKSSINHNEERERESNTQRVRKTSRGFGPVRSTADGTIAWKRETASSCDDERLCPCFDFLLKRAWKIAAGRWPAALVWRHLAHSRKCYRRECKEHLSSTRRRKSSVFCFRSSYLSVES